MISQPILTAEPADRISGLGWISNALPMPIIVVGVRGEILYANPAAEQFFATSSMLLLRQKLSDLLPFGSPRL